MMTRPTRLTSSATRSLPRRVGLLGLLAMLLQVAAVAQSMPQTAQPGDCFARIAQPPVFEKRTEQVRVVEASERVEVTPAEYEWTEQTVVIRPASERVVEARPAEYRTVEERVMVSPASERIEEVPARFRTESVSEMVKPATRVWKPGRGAIERIDSVSGEVLCLVEEPAVYREVQRQVLVEPATTRRVPIAAEYRSVRRQELLRPAETRIETVPAQTEAVRVRKLVRPASERRVPVPARYDSVTREVEVSASRVDWHPVLCNTNANHDLVLELQRALQRAGFSPGKVDGKLGRMTYEAVDRYQRVNGLPTGGITFDTLDRLGVNARSSDRT